MINSERTIEVDATAEQVWAVLGRFMHIDEFAPRVKRMAMEYDVKYGPLGWLMGQTMMRMMLGRIFLGVLHGLEHKVLDGLPTEPPAPEEPPSAAPRADATQ